MMNDEIQGKLRPISDIFKLDAGNSSFGSTLESDHLFLSQITLSESVPADVRQLFETAKNLSLYSWFVYRFHQVAELIGFSAMEMALRERYVSELPADEEPAIGAENGLKKRRRTPSLSALLTHAQNKHWITNHGFPDFYEIAYRAAQAKKRDEIIQSGALNVDESVEIPYPTEEEINAALSSLDIVGGIVKYAPILRNDLAHGSAMLLPGSISTLKKIADLINQIFTKP
ncbi:MAG: hypothetical protein WD071_10795 [Pseudohongiella sp.]|uniref:hypothetical protein n=1 Tax=Pseudohongiella sp. TaxID=1979412 RepID=UPI00349FF5EB